MPTQRRSQATRFGIDVGQVVADAARPHKRKKNPTKKQQDEEERRQRAKAAKKLQKQQEKECKAEEKRLAQEQAQERRDQAIQQEQTAQQIAQLEKERQQQQTRAKEAAIAKRQHRVAAGLSASPRGSESPSLSRSSLPYRDLQKERAKFKDFLRVRQEAGPEAENRIMSDEIEEMDDEPLRLERDKWAANPDLTIQGTMRLGSVQHWSSSFKTSFRDFDMAHWGSQLKAIWETGCEEERGWQIRKILVRVWNWEASKSVFQDQSLSEFSNEEWVKVEAIILSVVRK